MINIFAQMRQIHTVFKLHMLKSLDKGSELMKYAWFLVLQLQ